MPVKIILVLWAEMQMVKHKLLKKTFGINSQIK